MNAAVALGVPVSTILQHAHTVSVCLSKVGLNAKTNPRRHRSSCVMFVDVIGFGRPSRYHARWTPGLYIQSGAVP